MHTNKMHLFPSLYFVPFIFLLNFGPKYVWVLICSVSQFTTCAFRSSTPYSNGRQNSQLQKKGQESRCTTREPLAVSLFFPLAAWAKQTHGKEDVPAVPGDRTQGMGALERRTPLAVLPLEVNGGWEGGGLCSTGKIFRSDYFRPNFIPVTKNFCQMLCLNFLANKVPTNF